MKFCIVSIIAYDPIKDGKPCTLEINNLPVWATIMGGVHYNGIAFDLGWYGVGYEYFNNFDVVMVAVRDVLIEVAIKIKQHSKAKVIVYPEPELEHFTTFIPRNLQIRLIELLNMADAVAVVNEDTIPFFRQLTSKPVGFVGLPFPLKRVRETLCPPVEKEQVILLGGLMGSVISRNGLVNLAVLSKIGLPGLVDIQLPIENDYMRIIDRYVKVPRVTCCQNVTWENFIAKANKCIFGVHMDYRLTWGRFPIDCAAVRMPCIAPPNLYTQKILFPRLCVQYQDVDKAAELARDLLDKQNFYDEIMAYAESKLPVFDYELSKKRLLDLL